MADGTRKVSGSGVEGKKWIQVQGKKRVNDEKEEQDGEREGRYRAGKPHSLMTREARGK